MVEHYLDCIIFDVNDPLRGVGESTHVVRSDGPLDDVLQYYSWKVLFKT